ncbi:hypothetical protein, partial [Burkholderia seminalis]|uniref:hypothetical protein n=1 Tax=Burkholderia seminalis TaxID=488731 RepID=UPI001581B27D
ARRSGTGRWQAGVDRACPCTCTRVRGIRPRIGIRAVERIAGARHRQPCRIVRAVRRERTGRELTGPPYRRARLHTARHGDTPAFRVIHRSSFRHRAA